MGRRRVVGRPIGVNGKALLLQRGDDFEGVMNRFFVEQHEDDRFFVVEGSPPAAQVRTVGLFEAKEDAEAICEFMNEGRLLTRQFTMWRPGHSVRLRECSLRRPSPRHKMLC